MKPKASLVPRWSKLLVAAFALVAVTLFGGVACGAVARPAPAVSWSWCRTRLRRCKCSTCVKSWEETLRRISKTCWTFQQVLEGLRKWGILRVDVRTLAVAESGSGKR